MDLKVIQMALSLQIMRLSFQKNHHSLEVKMMNKVKNRYNNHSMTQKNKVKKQKNQRLKEILQEN